MSNKKVEVKQEILLDPDVLDNIYQNWSSKEFSNCSFYYKQRYQREARFIRKNQRFEEWLWSHGFTVIQKDKKRYLKFIGEKKYLTMFLLKNNINNLV